MKPQLVLIRGIEVRPTCSECMLPLDEKGHRSCSDKHKEAEETRYRALVIEFNETVARIKTFFTVMEEIHETWGAEFSSLSQVSPLMNK